MTRGMTNYGVHKKWEPLNWQKQQQPVRNKSLLLHKTIKYQQLIFNL